MAKTKVIKPEELQERATKCGLTVALPSKTSKVYLAWWALNIQANVPHTEEGKFLAMDAAEYAMACADDMHYSDASLVRFEIGKNQAWYAS